jgi:hypothetical protein
MAVRFRFDSFRPGKERWETYEARLRFALRAADLNGDAEKKNAFLPICSGEVYEALVSHLHPLRVDNVFTTFNQIINALQARYGERNVTPIMAEHDFVKRNQKPGEPIIEWLAELRRLASRCEFGADLERRLVTQLVHGTLDKDARLKLIKKRELDLDTVVDTLEAYERVQKDSERLGATSQLEPPPYLLAHATQAPVSTGRPQQIAYIPDGKGGWTKAYISTQPATNNLHALLETTDLPPPDPDATTGNVERYAPKI